MGTLSSIARIHGSRNQELEIGMVLLTITHSKSLGRFLFPVPITLHSAGLEVLVPQGGMLQPGDTAIISLNWKLRFPPGHFGLLMPLSQQATNRVMVLPGVIDPDYQGHIELFLHNGVKETYSWSAGHPLGLLLMLPYPVVRSIGN